MFYSQFILAKKGPLGTIWIAAHLERKLRKNQVADTDIGVSVDSILFPEVPIALRLSSHLLLGVVRIYSRKVNYLFHDCSEALLKIKQAFRSTAVDLPPEESTAPYHSITLPETFDLDDFELPDSVFLHGNFVDHHVSTREQITLQDTMEGLAYSTSQFGLDERFGDGDASQIGLDLDEDLFLENVLSPGHASVLLGSKKNGDPQMPGEPETPFTNMGEPETPFTNMGEPETPFTNMGEPETPFTNMGEPETPFTNMGEPETPFTNMGEPETPFTNMGEPETPFTNMDIDEDQNKYHEGMSAETSKDIPELLASGCGVQIGSDTRDLHEEVLPCKVLIGSDTQDLHEEVLPCERIGGPSTDPNDMRAFHLASKAPSTEMIESAQAPSTPRMEEAIPANVQEVPVLNHLRKSSQSNAMEITVTDIKCIPHVDSEHNDLTKAATKDNLGTSFNEPDIHVVDANHAVVSTPADDKSADIVHPVPNDENNESPLGSKPAVTILVSSGELTLERDQENTETLHNELLCHDREPNLLVVDQIHSNGESSAGVDGVGMDSHLAEDCLPKSEGILNIENVIQKDNSEPQPSKNLDPVEAADDSCSPNHTLPTGADCQLGSVGILELENVESKACSVPQNCKNLNLEGPDERPCAHSHVLQPCSSPPNQPSALPLEDGLLVENAPDLLSREVGLSTSEIPGRATAMVQGEEGCSANVTGTSLEDKQMLEAVSSHLNKSDEFVGIVISNDTQLETSNCLGSSEFPAPETLLSAPGVVPYSVNDLVGQSSAAKKALTECEVSVDHLKSLSGQKRRLMESTPVLQDGNLAKFSAMSRSKRSVDDIPDDDDILASILVGKRSSVLKMRSTPPPLEVSSSKRPRVTPRTSAPKRKTLLDDPMVLHGDAIRQQLTNTEDIRRIRRKAPCTRPEIWMIQKYLLEDEIFSEPLFTGMSVKLTGLLNQGYIVTNAVGDSIEVTEDLELSRSLELVKGIGEPAETMTDKNDGEAQEPAETFLQIDNQLCDTLVCDTNERTEALNDIALDSSKDGQSLETTSMGIDEQVNGADVANNAGINGADMPISAAPPSEDDFNISADYRVESTAVDENNGTEATPQKNEDLSCSSPDQKLIIHPSNELGEMNDETSCLVESTRVEKDGSIVDTVRVADILEVAEVGDETSVLVGEGGPIGRDASDMENTGGGNSIDGLQECQTDVGEIGNDGKLVHLLDNCPEEIEAGINPFIPDVTVENCDPNVEPIVSMEEIGKVELDVVIEGGVVFEKAADEGDSLSRHICTEGPQMASSGSLEPNTDLENAPLNGENLGCKALNRECDIDVATTAVDISAVIDSDDFGNLMDDNDTEFLNVDDEAEPEAEEEPDMPSAVEDRFLENSGWSSRTRAVAKYLKSLFDNEAGRGIKTLPVDNLLAGKTRKEASRMFFETLVLKTKDYIHVEQENPFENINIQPRLKLLKSEF